MTPWTTTTVINGQLMTAVELLLLQMETSRQMASARGGLSPPLMGPFRLWTLLMVASTTAAVAAGDSGASKDQANKAATLCLQRIRKVMENNSPELLVLPNENELSAFTTSR